MSRYLLDTNILVYMLLSETDSISNETDLIIDDYNNQLFTSSISIMELVQLCNISKIKSKKFKTSHDLITVVENEYFIKISPFTKEHSITLAKLKIASAHNDPFDHAIIATAIKENLKLVSSDKKFYDYTAQKLLFCFNKR